MRSTYKDRNNKLILADGVLLVFLDETGDPSRLNSYNPAFGFGGLAITHSQRSDLSGAWRVVREVFTGSKENIMHANQIKNVDDYKNNVLREFFFKDFFRFCVIGHNKTLYLKDDKDAVFWVKIYIILDKIVDMILLSQRHDFSEIVLIFEKSSRDKKIENVIKKYNNPLKHIGVEIVCAFVGKEIKEECVEIADFIAFSASIIVRKRLNIKISNEYKESWPDFVFGVPSERTFFLDISEIAMEPGKQ